MPLGLAVAILLYPLVHLRNLYTIVLLPDMPMLAPILRELKLGSLVVVGLALFTLTRSRNPK
jgi:hypothetical protein